MYFPFWELRKWGKKAAETRRRNCAVLPLQSVESCDMLFPVLPVVPR